MQLENYIVGQSNKFFFFGGGGGEGRKKPKSNSFRTVKFLCLLVNN